MKPILILQHMLDNPSGYVGELLKGYGLAYQVIRADLEALSEDPQAYSAIIAFGGSQHVYETEKYPYFIPEASFIRQAITQDLPYLGICLGGQLLAYALGGTISKHHVSEVGFYTVPLTEAGQRDPLYHGLDSEQKVFHWHEDVFDLVDGCTLLASTPGTPHQAFRYGARAYGLQYHIEITPETLHQWLYHPALDETSPDPDVERMRAQETHLKQDFTVYHQHTEILLKNFLILAQII
jgi:GMP synthase-like glutamine amidotransferase